MLICPGDQPVAMIPKHERSRLYVVAGKDVKGCQDRNSAETATLGMAARITLLRKNC
jgi:hypothetical protein